MSDFSSVARRWLAAEPDSDMRDELTALLAGPPDDLAVRFDGRLQFGTAGLRAAVGAGPQRMNRLVVRQAAAQAHHGLHVTARKRFQGVGERVAGRHLGQRHRS